jgi:hypothetical protein
MRSVGEVGGSRRVALIAGVAVHQPGLEAVAPRLALAVKIPVLIAINAVEKKRVGDLAPW